MTRKLAIAGLSAMSSSGLQLVWGGVVVFASLNMTLLNRPFESHLIHKMEITALTSLCGTVILGFHFLLLDSEHLWTTTILIMLNGSVGLFLFFCCISKVSGVLLQKVERFIPDSWPHAKNMSRKLSRRLTSTGMTEFVTISKTSIQPGSNSTRTNSSMTGTGSTRASGAVTTTTATVGGQEQVHEGVVMD